MTENQLHHNLPSVAPVKPRILLAASGSVAAIKFETLCHCFTEWAEVKVVVTKSALHFIDKGSLPRDVTLYTDDDEWSTWKKLSDEVLHIELRKWADALVIAPLSANTLAKIAGGLCDNLLTCIIRAWDYSKPLYIAPAMNTLMWSNPFTKRHLETVRELSLIITSSGMTSGIYRQAHGGIEQPIQLPLIVPRSSIQGLMWSKRRKELPKEIFSLGTTTPKR